MWVTCVNFIQKQNETCWISSSQIWILFGVPEALILVSSGSGGIPDTAAMQRHPMHVQCQMVLCHIGVGWRPLWSMWWGLLCPRCISEPWQNLPDRTFLRVETEYAAEFQQKQNIEASLVSRDPRLVYFLNPQIWWKGREWAGAVSRVKLSPASLTAWFSVAPSWRALELIQHTEGFCGFLQLPHKGLYIVKNPVQQLLPGTKKNWEKDLLLNII